MAEHRKCCKIKSRHWFDCFCMCVCARGREKTWHHTAAFTKKWCDKDALGPFFFLRWDVWIFISRNISLFLLIRLSVVFVSKVSLLWHAAWAYLDQAVMHSSGWCSPALTLNVSNAVCSRGKNSTENLPSGGLCEIICGHLCGPSVRIQHFWAADLSERHCVWIWLISAV